MDKSSLSIDRVKSLLFYPVGPAEATTQELEQSDVEMLLSRLRDQLPESDVLSHTIQVKRVEWEEVKFGEFSAKDCEEMWNKILKSVSASKLSLSTT